MAQCHCGKDGHALNSVNCPVHGITPNLDEMLSTFVGKALVMGRMGATSREVIESSITGELISAIHKLIIKEAINANN